MEDKYTKYIRDGIAYIPYGTKVIEADAFCNCQEIKGAVIPNTVKIIEGFAFNGCISLDDIEIPNSVCIIGEAAFAYSGLKHIDLPESVSQVGGGAFAGTDLVDIVIPSSVNIIEESTFEQCKCLKKVDLPDGLECIGDSAFSMCESLVSITIPDSVRSIGVMAFAGCKSLTKLQIPSGISSIGEMAFSMCTGINSVENFSICYHAINNCLIKHDELIFGGKDSFIPKDSGIRIIKKQSFFWQNIQTLEIPWGVRIIEDQAFSCCKQLTHIELPYSLETIEGNPFSYCSQLSSIQADGHFLYGSFVSEGNCLLDLDKTILYVGCKNSEIPYTVKELHHEAFLGSGIERIHIPRSVEIIGNNVFKDCKSLVSVHIPSSIIRWGYGVFSGCYNLRTIEFFVERPSLLCHKVKKDFVEGLDLSQITLVVPIGSGYEYRNDSVFSDCKEILPQLRKEDPLPPLQPDHLF